MDKWDNRFLDLARTVSTWSKDPSTQTGAVIVRPDKTVAALGYNGFARGCDDADGLYNDRQEKYARIIHCEMNAVLSAREPLHGCTLYTWPFMSCDRCAMHMIQVGIRRTVAPKLPQHLEERWADSVGRARTCFAEAGVRCEEV
jgi:dCMP deaminase